MRLVLVDNLLLEDGKGEDLYLRPHLGLISLVSVATGAGHTALVYDPKLDVTRGDLKVGPSLYRDIAARLLALDPDVLGFTSLGCNFICTLKVAQYVKAKRPHLPILLGGPHATILDKQILDQFLQFDVIVRNEAELTLLPVLEQLSGGDLGLIPGVTYRSESGIRATPGEPQIADLDTLPWPAFESYPLASLGLSTIEIEAGRGCPFKCSFCSTATFFGRRYRLKSPQRIGAEMDYLNKNYGVTDFGLTHDLFTVDKRKVLAFCQFMRGKGYTWGCSARMDCVDDELLAEMRAAGCRSVYYGVETGSPRMQKIVDKHLNLALVEPRLATTRRLGMTATASFITGFPEEEQSDQNETLDMMGECLTRDPETVNVQLHLLTPEPGTGLTQRLSRSLGYDGHITEFTFPTLENDDMSIMQGNPAIFMNHHYYLSAISRERHVFATSLYGTLQSFGFVAVRHLIEISGGRLSALIDDMYRWVSETRWEAPYDDELVCAYLEQRFAGHYLTSAFEFLRTARGIDSQALPKARVAPRRIAARRGGAVPGRRLVITPRAAMLRGIHNAPEILEVLKGTGPVPARLRKQRLDLLIFVPAGSTEIEAFELGRGAVDLVTFLGSPRSTAELRKFERSLGGDPDKAVAFARQFRGLGLLVDATDRQLPAADAVDRFTRTERWEAVGAS
jgi:radical SAM superfamily enzyme YgiQ (UPF0313 family)